MIQCNNNNAKFALIVCHRSFCSFGTANRHLRNKIQISIVISFQITMKNVQLLGWIHFTHTPIKTISHELHHSNGDVSYSDDLIGMIWRSIATVRCECCLQEACKHLKRACFDRKPMDLVSLNGHHITRFVDAKPITNEAGSIFGYLF